MAPFIYLSGMSRRWTCFVVAPAGVVEEEVPFRMRLFQTIVIFSLVLIPAIESYALDNIIRKGFTFGGSAGYGYIDVNHDDNMHDSSGSLALGFHGGYALTPNIILGLELNGWTIKASDLWDPSKGESVSNYSLFFNAFPFETPVYFSGGGAISRYTNNSPDADGRESGTSWFIGCGYEIPITDRFMYAPQIRYSRGSFSGGDYGVTELSIAFHWYSNSKTNRR